MEFLGKRPGTTEGTLVLGNPDLGSEELSLPFAEREAREVAALVPGSTLLTGSAATETAIKRQAGGYRRVHVASHAELDWRQPLNSGILLSKDETNDGRLTTAEIYALRLPADLVTLSACETALGDVTNADDMIGLTRGFLFAGVTTIVATQWKIDDEAARALMVAFYRHLQRYDKVEALRQAQLDIRSEYPDPYHWAAFQVIGGAR